MLHPPGTFGIGHTGLETPFDAPEAFHFVNSRPDLFGYPCQIRGAEGGGFHINGPDYCFAQDIGLKPHQEIVNGGTSVYAKFADGLAGVGFHGVDKFATLEGDAFERGADDVGFAGGAGEPGDDAAGAGIPVGRSQADEGGDYVNSSRVGDRCGYGFGALLVVAAC